MVRHLRGSNQLPEPGKAPEPNRHSEALSFRFVSDSFRDIY